ALHPELCRSRVEVKKSLRKSMALEQARREGRRVPRRSHRPQLLQYSEHVRYVEQLRRYHAVFPAEQVLVLIYDDFRRDNEATVRRVLRFLGLREDVPIEAVEANPTVGGRSLRLGSAVRGLHRGRRPVAPAGK